MPDARTENPGSIAQPPGAALGDAEKSEELEPDMSDPNAPGRDTPRQPTTPLQPPPAVPPPPASAVPAGAFPPQATGYAAPQRFGPVQPKGLAIAALIVGIASLVLGWLPFVGNAIGIGGGIAAVILGIVAVKKAQSKGMSVAGIVTGAVAIVLSIISIVIWILIFGFATTAVRTAVTGIEQLTEDLGSSSPGIPEAVEPESPGARSCFAGEPGRIT
ncbi:DUF4190 domain-containing protein [Leucobacter sp. wl10]|nr:DUF4190 domain-containing protein [Leucobacter sp. wl10]